MVSNACQWIDWASTQVFSSAINGLEQAANGLKSLEKSCFQKVALIANGVLRFVGFAHKLWCPGYHFFNKQLTQEDAHSYLRYACAAGAVHLKKEEWIAPFELHFSKHVPDIEGAQKRSNCLYDPETTLKVIVAEGSGKEVIIAFGAVHSADTEVLDPKEQKKICRAQNWTATASVLGKIPDVFRKANKIIVQLKAHYEKQGKILALSGNCFGGCLAQYVGLKNKVKTYCFNTCPLGAGLQYDLGFSALNQADEFVTHISAQGDPVSNFPKIHIVDFFLQILFLRTPGNFGKRFSIPSAYKIASETHKYFIGSLMEFIGKDFRTEPWKLAPDELVPFSDKQP